MSNWTVSLLVVIVFFVVMLYQSQQKFKNKMLCTFIRPNRQKIEQWVPLDSKYIVFDRGRYGIGRYEVDPNCIAMMWYNRGFNRFFPILIPTLEFKWDTPNPLNPATFLSTWKTPESMEAGWEEHQHVAFAKATVQATGKRSRFPEWFFPVLTIGLVAITLILVWNGISGMEQRMGMIEQQIKLIVP